MKYKVIVKTLRHDLEIEVNKLIQEGWKPLGGISYDWGNCYGDTYAQAMLFGGEE